MAWRFKRRIKVAPGIRLNLSKGGVGMSVGPRGASVSTGAKGTKAHVGIPGTGISAQKRISSGGASVTWWTIFIVLGVAVGLVILAKAAFDLAAR